jgi:hypothetical protein
MKFISTMISAAVLGCVPILNAQEPPLPAATETPSASPSATASVRPELNIPEIPLTVEPAPLVPNTSNTSPPPSKSAPPLEELDAAFKRSSLGQAVEEQRMHVEWRKLKNRTVDDPDIVAAKAATEKARTDLEKRNLLRAYYKLYYGRLEALASTPELKAFIDGKKKAILVTLDQPTVRPNPTPGVSPSP